MARTPLSADEKSLIWRLAKQGRNWQAIGRGLGRHPSIVNNYAQSCGGLAPRIRSRAASQLSLGEREEISRGLAAGWSLRQIATALGRAPSTISREVSRHGGREHYRASSAEHAAWANGCRPKPCKLGASPRLRAIVEEKLNDDWSPEQIARWLRRHFPDDPELQVSHETIYVTLFVQARGALRRELTTHLRSKRHHPSRQDHHRPQPGQGPDRRCRAHQQTPCRG